MQPPGCSPTPYGLCLAPAYTNYLIAGILPVSLVACYSIDASDFPQSFWLIDHVVATLILRQPIGFILKSSVNVIAAGEPADLAALRVSSALTLIAVLIHVLVYALGRTGLMSIVFIHTCVKLQAGCWIAAIAQALQSAPLTSFCHSELKHTLDGSALNLRDRILPHLPWEALALLRALVPVLLLGPGTDREAALRLLNPDVVRKLQRPLVDSLPERARQMIHAPWQEVERLRLVRSGGTVGRAGSRAPPSTAGSAGSEAVNSPAAATPAATAGPRAASPVAFAPSPSSLSSTYASPAELLPEGAGAVGSSSQSPSSSSPIRMRIPAADESDESDDDDDEAEEEESMNETDEATDAAAVEEAFAAATAAAATPPSSLPRSDKLLLYGLYKQATCGDAPMSCPASRFDVAGRLKYDSWAALRGTDTTTAKVKYARTVQEHQCGGALAGSGLGQAGVAENAGVGAAPSAPAEPSSALQLRFPSGRLTPPASDATGATASPSQAPTSTAPGSGRDDTYLWASKGHDLAVLAPEVLLLKVAAKGILTAAKERTSVGRCAVRLASLPWDALDYVRSFVPGAAVRAERLVEPTR